MPPDKKDKVKFIGGKLKGQIGELIGIESDEGIVTYQSEIMIMPMNILAKYVTS